jgi:very-short-patch-repair endonuclease
VARREDEYGNTLKRSSQSRGGPAPSIGRLRQTATYRGGVPYQAFRRGRVKGAGVGNVSTQPFPDPPDTWMGTLPEWAIYWAHLAIGRKPYQDFQYQYSFDGSTIFDFFEFQERLAIEVQGLYWHYEFQKQQVVNDQLRKIRAEAVGITLIFIDEDNALADPIFYLREALAERDHSRAATGRSI